jgi:hypothetical protein
MLILVAKEFIPFNQGKRKTRCRSNNLLCLMKYTRKEIQASFKAFTKFNVLLFSASGSLLRLLTASKKIL